MANTHLRLNGRRRLIGLLASVVTLIFVALPAAQASANYSVYYLNPAGDPQIITPDPYDNFFHQNGYCTKRVQPTLQCIAWRSSPGANNFITYGPYITLPYGYYQACWRVADLTPGQGPQLWMQTTADQGRRYLGGTAPVIAAGYNYYCYWFGSGYAMGNVEFRAIMGNHASNSQVEISPMYVQRYY